MQCCVRYVAPELLQQESAASSAADMYSLGATIYEVATGMRIPRGEEARRSGVRTPQRALPERKPERKPAQEAPATPQPPLLCCESYVLT